MVVAVAIFSMVMVIAMGALLSVINANRQNQAIQTAVSNLNLALETLSREIRVGSRYHCGASGTLTTPQDCLTNGEDYLSFLSFEGYQIVFRLNSKRLERSDDGGSSFLFLTSPAVSLEEVKFYVSGSDSTDDIQPRVVITASGYVEVGSQKEKSYFDLQTTVSQRLIDF
jgi:type II secretory pathway pseudopilin PulG